MVSVSATSSSIDTFLILLDSKGNVRAMDDNSGGGSNAVLNESLEPGTYYVVVKPAEDVASAGDYVLTTTNSPVPAP